MSSKGTKIFVLVTADAFFAQAQELLGLTFSSLLEPLEPEYIKISEKELIQKT